MKKLFILIYFLVISLLWVVDGFTATYYMRADGTAANMAAATGPCGTVGNCASLATHNAAWQSFSPGDIINICDDGGTFEGQLTIGSDGSSGNPIIYQAASGDSSVPLFHRYKYRKHNPIRIRHP